MIVKINDVVQTVTSVSVDQHVYVTITIDEIITNGPVKVEFHATAENNPDSVGFRVDNIKLTGDER